MVETSKNGEGPMNKHSWKRWSTIAFCAAPLGVGMTINLSPSPAWAQAREMTKEDDYRDVDRYPPKLGDFLETLDKLTAAIDSLVYKINNDRCIDQAKLDDYLLSLNNALAALSELTRQSGTMLLAHNKAGATYITSKQYNSYNKTIDNLTEKVLEAKDRLHTRACFLNQDSMVPPPDSKAGDDDWPDPGGHVNVVHRSPEPYPRRGDEGQGGQPYNWPGGGNYPDQDKGPYPGPDGGDHPGPGGGAYPVPGGGAYPGPGGM
jgi:hypothetical protein